MGIERRVLYTALGADMGSNEFHFRAFQMKHQDRQNCSFAAGQVFRQNIITLKSIFPAFISILADTP